MKHLLQHIADGANSFDPEPGQEFIHPQKVKDILAARRYFIEFLPHPNDTKGPYDLIYVGGLSDEGIKYLSE